MDREPKSIDLCTDVTCRQALRDYPNLTIHEAKVHGLQLDWKHTAKLGFARRSRQKVSQQEL